MLIMESDQQYRNLIASINSQIFFNGIQEIKQKGRKEDYHWAWWGFPTTMVGRNDNNNTKTRLKYI